jgi:hypothetical protein
VNVQVHVPVAETDPLTVQVIGAAAFQVTVIVAPDV